MQLTLTPEESSLLIRHLTQQIEHLDSELVHTDKRDLQRDLARELQALRTLTDRIRSSVPPLREGPLLDVVDAATDVEDRMPGAWQERQTSWRDR